MINLIKVQHYDVVNGPGIRTSIWFAGCNNNCKGCWSKHTWDPHVGKPLNEWLETIDKYLSDEKVKGVSILGGDPFYWLFQNQHVEELIEFFKYVHSFNKSVWVWTGYLFEQVYEKNPEILNYIDILVDGKFKEHLKDMRLLWRGSSNQRIINVKEKIKSIQS